jgi:hypothetical protein
MASSTEFNRAPFLPASKEIAPNALDSAEQFKGSQNGSETPWGDLNEQSMHDHSNSVTCTIKSRRSVDSATVDSEAGRTVKQNLRAALNSPMQAPIALYGSGESYDVNLAVSGFIGEIIGMQTD